MSHLRCKNFSIFFLCWKNITWSFLRSKYVSTGHNSNVLLLLLLADHSRSSLNSLSASPLTFSISISKSKSNAKLSSSVQAHSQRKIFFFLKYASNQCQCSHDFSIFLKMCNNFLYESFLIMKGSVNAFPKPE